MQIRALYDQKGRILAAVQVETSEAVRAGSPAPQPEPKRGKRVGVFTVPPECAHLSVSQACAQLVVKTEGKRVTLAAHPSSKSARRFVRTQK